jgi:hypothetical protein
MTPEQRATITKRIGPIRRTLEIDPLGSGWLLVGAAIVLALVGLTFLNLPVEHWGSVAGLMILLLVMGTALAPLFFEVRKVLARVERDCLLVGKRGLAEVRSGKVSFVLWAELGVQWRPLPVALDAAHSVDPIVLLLEREDGRRFRLRAHYPGVRAVRLLIGRYLRQQSQRALLTPRPAVEEQRVWAERPAPEWSAPGIFGPWTGSDADHVIGPVRQVCPPRAEVVEPIQEQVQRPFVLGFMTASLLLLGGVAVLVAGKGSDERSGVVGVCLFSIALASFVASFAYRAHRLWPLQSFLLVGEHGVAIWHPDGSRIVAWDDLGTAWHADPDITRGDLGEAGAGVLLKLRHTDGQVFYITDLYENALLVVARVREELQRDQPGDRPRRALRQRGPSSKAIRAPAHFSETPPLPAVSPMPHESPAEEEEFVCAPRRDGSIPATLLLLLLGFGFVAFAALDLLGCGLLMWGLFALAGLAIHVGREIPGRWRVGPEELAYQDGLRTDVLRWDDLGIGWRVFFLNQDGNAPAQLVFLLADGTELSVPANYDGATRLEARIRSELTRRLEQRPASEEP